MKFLIMEDFCYLVGFAEIVGKHCTFFMKLCRENWLSVREALSGWVFYCCFVEFAEIKDKQMSVYEKSVIHYLTLLMCYLKKRKFKNTVKLVRTFILRLGGLPA